MGFGTLDAGWITQTTDRDLLLTYAPRHRGDGHHLARRHAEWRGPGLRRLLRRPLRPRRRDRSQYRPGGSTRRPERVSMAASSATSRATTSARIWACSAGTMTSSSSSTPSRRPRTPSSTRWCSTSSCSRRSSGNSPASSTIRCSILLNGVNLATLSDGAAATVNNLMASPFGPVHPDLVLNPAGSGPLADFVRADGYTEILSYAGRMQDGVNTLVIEVEDALDGFWDSGILVKGGTFKAVRLDRRPVGRLRQRQAALPASPRAATASRYRSRSIPACAAASSHRWSSRSRRAPMSISATVPAWRAC